tara:strand:+ start:1594 stop:1968 length:375 start_codon:yes stop_codon:yes gene_type:complete
MAAKRKTSKASAKKGLKNLSQIHGEEEKFQPTSLDQVWGEDGSSTYGTMNDAEYERQIDEMNMSDMQTHASRVGIIPIDNRSTLRDRLLREFRKHVANYRKPIHHPTPPEEVDAQTLKILSEGR